MRNHLKIYTIGMAFVIASPISVQSATISLYGTELTIQSLYQQNADSELQELSFASTATVGPGVEISNLADLEIASNPFNLFIVPVSIDVGEDYIELDYSIGDSSGAFASGTFNGYKFTFDGSVPINILNATVNPVSNIVGFDDSRLSFDGNSLFANVHSLSFSSSSQIRIDLTVPPPMPAAPIPLPAALWMLVSGIAVLASSRARTFLS